MASNIRRALHGVGAGGMVAAGGGTGGTLLTQHIMAGRCSFTLSTPVFKPPMVSAISA